MKYSEATQFIMSQLPMFQNVGSVAYNGGLNNTIKMLEMLGNPHQKIPCIHIAGTNGKGSTSSILAAIFSASGYKTALFTSPHLKDFRERIRINGEVINAQYIGHFIDKNRSMLDEIKPSFFEMTTCLAFEYFANKKVDIAIIETGLGGRLDSTNVINPILSIITNIGKDHTALLGNTLAEIAKEKAGIIKPKVPVIIGEMNTETHPVFEETAIKNQCPIIYAEKNVSINILSHQFLPPNLKFRITSPFSKSISLETKLAGNYQLQNIKTVLASVNLLKSIGYKLKWEYIKKAFSSVPTLSGLHGRWEYKKNICHEIYDTGHNAHGLEQVASSLKQSEFNKLHYVIGIVNDKDPENIFKILPTANHYYFCKPPVERGMDAGQLAILARTKFGIEGLAYQNVRKALMAARKAAQPNDLIFIGGSTFVVGEVI